KWQRCLPLQRRPRADRGTPRPTSGTVRPRRAPRRVRPPPDGYAIGRSGVTPTATAVHAISRMSRLRVIGPNTPVGRRSRWPRAGGTRSSRARSLAEYLRPCLRWPAVTTISSGLNESAEPHPLAGNILVEVCPQTRLYDAGLTRMLAAVIQTT